MTPTPLLTYTLRLADNALVLGHRLSEWTAHAPTLEEEIALANLALDLVGQARMLYDYAAKIEGKGRREDDFAFLRDDRAFLNVLLVEQPNGDFAATMVRQLFFAAYAQPFYAALAGSKDETLAAIGAKAEKEMAYHLRHAGEWVIRLGDGTEESHARAKAALDDLVIYIDELFEVDAGDRALIEAGIAVDPAKIRPAFDKALGEILDEATLALPKVSHAHRGGREGLHSEHLGPMLAEMQVLHRAHPGAEW
ncbi:MAG: phenylacetate-CoA oxygenase subunit PaaC [Proteobacteria bacterium]|nr:phenylacetate-CoA oxygenase subunit PaaC [Pseudomonadota bacterium]